MRSLFVLFIFAVLLIPYISQAEVEFPSGSKIKIKWDQKINLPSGYSNSNHFYFKSYLISATKKGDIYSEINVLQEFSRDIPPSFRPQEGRGNLSYAFNDIDLNNLGRRNLFNLYGRNSLYIEVELFYDGFQSMGDELIHRTFIPLSEIRNDLLERKIIYKTFFKFQFDQILNSLKRMKEILENYSTEAEGFYNLVRNVNLNVVNGIQKKNEFLNEIENWSQLYSYLLGVNSYYLENKAGLATLDIYLPTENEWEFLVQENQLAPNETWDLSWINGIYRFESELINGINILSEWDFEQMRGDERARSTQADIVQTCIDLFEGWQQVFTKNNWSVSTHVLRFNIETEFSATD